LFSIINKKNTSDIVASVYHFRPTDWILGLFLVKLGEMYKIQELKFNVDARYLNNDFKMEDVSAHFSANNEV